MDQMTQEPVAVVRTGPALAMRIGLVGVAAAALVAVGILAAGATALPTSLLAADDDSTGTAEVEEGVAFHRGLGPGGPGLRAITITAISGSSIALETVDGWTRTITVDDGTEYYEDGETASLADLAVGDEVRFRQTLEDDGTWSIDAIVVIQPHAAGEVTAVDGSTITLERRDGSTTTVNVTDDTEFVVNGDDATLADVEVGMVLGAVGTENADGSLTATRVRAADRGELRERLADGPRFRHGPRDFLWNGGDAGDDEPAASAGAS